MKLSRVGSSHSHRFAVVLSRRGTIPAQVLDLPKLFVDAAPQPRGAFAGQRLPELTVGRARSGPGAPAMRRRRSASGPPHQTRAAASPS